MYQKSSPHWKQIIGSKNDLQNLLYLDNVLYLPARTAAHTKSISEVGSQAELELDLKPIFTIL